MNKSKLILLASLVLAPVASLFAANLPGGGGGMSPGCWPPPCSVPIDGGVSLLLAAGAAFGAKKIIDSRKK